MCPTHRRTRHRRTRHRSTRRRAPPSATPGVRGGRARWSIPETVRFPVHRECRVRSGAAMLSAAVVSSTVAQPPGATFTAQARRPVGISSRAERGPAPLNVRAVFRVRRCRADPRLRAPSTVRPRARAGAQCCVLHRNATCGVVQTCPVRAALIAQPRARARRAARPAAAAPVAGPTVARTRGARTPTIHATTPAPGAIRARRKAADRRPGERAWAAALAGACGRASKKPRWRARTPGRMLTKHG